MFSTKSFVLAALAAVASAAPGCAPPKATPTLPLTGGASELPAPPSNLVLKKIILGHGIQNYSCADAAATPEAKGALAALYDITALYPSKQPGALSIDAFNALTTKTLWQEDVPLNLVNTAAAVAGAVLSSKEYGATTSPFQAPADLKLAGLAPIKYAGRHYFDSTGTPNFDLIGPGNLKAHVVKKAGVAVPANADKGPLKTGAVQWLQLGDSGLSVSNGISQVYRVVTAGGVAESCTTTGAGLASVPYTAQYWFYG
ncbi:hypothetical protein B0T16DRAFT_109898 [Cercophora newfieldiana]|uniref:Malate dehydrogenase n=1 Tax=Cercophora newfieldiana TaxID=92897 RepID=A0AA40CVF8_9PEZI|nr:hypothetical protein B0T16DRAFT_109898 [Cercophora newfieldiana]